MLVLLVVVVVVVVEVVVVVVELVVVLALHYNSISCRIRSMLSLLFNLL